MRCAKRREAHGRPPWASGATKQIARKAPSLRVSAAHVGLVQRFPSVARHRRALTMHDLLPAWPLLSAFLVASLILAVMPGPAVFYIVTRSIAQGRRCGLAS